MNFLQAAERTVTPMFEIAAADSTAPTSASVSKSNSELSVRNCLDPKSFNNHHHHQSAANPVVRHLHLPSKSVDDSSDVSRCGVQRRFFPLSL